MDSMDKQDFFKKNGRLLTKKEILELDDLMFQASEEIRKRIGEICGILGSSDSVIRTWRGAYLSAEAALDEKKNRIAELEREAKEKLELENRYHLLQEEQDDLKAALENVNQEKNEALGRVQKLEKELSEQKERYQVLEIESKEIRQKYSQDYTDVRTDKLRIESELERVKSELDEEKERAENLQKDLAEEEARKQEAVEKAYELDRKLSEETQKAEKWNEEAEQYKAKEQKMPKLVCLYDAYDAVMEKRKALPRTFTDCIKDEIPLDNFDGFLVKMFNRLFPISYYLAIESFVNLSAQYGDASSEEIKEALRVSDDFLTAVFDLGDKYFKGEKLFRIGVNAGSQYDSFLCKYIDDRGGNYGNIGKVWLQGFRDEKNDRIYCSYVEGE